MPTVEEILRESGFTSDEITALDKRAITAFSGVLSTATQAQQAAELAQRSNIDFYENRIVPSLTNWEEEKQRIENEKARATAEAAFYKVQNEEARKVGFVPSDAPGFSGRDQSGRYVANAPGGTPGSPTYTGVSMNDIDEKLGNGLSNAVWALQEFQRLNPGQYLPDSFDRLAQEATVSRMPFREFVSRKYNFEGKRQEIQQKAQADHDAKIVREAEQRKDREWAEKVGSNPDMRVSMRSPEMTDIARASKAGKVPDPLLLNDNERRAATRQMIRSDLQEQQNS